MRGSARVLGPGCGPLDAPLMFVGEAPGRLGADGSHIPFHGDKSGHNFERLIEQVGISRYEVFVTNAVLCNPKDEKGNNATPLPDEVKNCAPFLKETIEILSAKFVVTLGAVALKACDIVERHSLSLSENVRTNRSWMQVGLIPLYHPGQRAMVHRSFANQLSDYQFVAELLRRASVKTRKKAIDKPRQGAKKLGHVARHILESQPKGVSYFALHKLCFLAEAAHLEATGKRLTNTYVVRQKDGPYFVDLHLAKLPPLIGNISVTRSGEKILLSASRQIDFHSDGTENLLSAAEADTLERIIQKYASYSDADLKTVVYLNSYMRRLLRRERSGQANLYNAPVLPFRGKNEAAHSV